MISASIAKAAADNYNIFDSILKRIENQIEKVAYSGQYDTEIVINLSKYTGTKEEEASRLESIIKILEDKGFECHIKDYSPENCFHVIYVTWKNAS